MMAVTRVALMALTKTMRAMWLLVIHNSSESREHHHTEVFPVLLMLLAGAFE